MKNGEKILEPRFQRDYSWENEHWRDLWEDIELINSKKKKSLYGLSCIRRNRRTSLQSY